MSFFEGEAVAASTPPRALSTWSNRFLFIFARHCRLSVSFKPLGVEGPDLICLLLCGEAGGDSEREDEEEEEEEVEFE